jgi:hypothetical protein
MGLRTCQAAVNFMTHSWFCASETVQGLDATAHSCIAQDALLVGGRLDGMHGFEVAAGETLFRGRPPQLPNASWNAPECLSACL